MRALGLVIALGLGPSVSATAYAQTALEGPLAAPDAKPAATKAKPSKTKTARHKAKTAHRGTSHSPAVDESGSAVPQPVVHKDPATPSDPVSFGMKWNGSNDTAKATRVQNYDGNATGTGGEVGMKFHF